jgi:hypothetical protein
MPDVKLLKPERISDNPDGGGLSTGIELVDGQVNNLFDDISRIDRVNGDVSLRKTFVQADTANTDLFSGLHIIVQARPQDPRVDALLFETGSWSDERDNARQYVERFLDESVITRMIPYDRQLAGQRLVLVFQRVEAALPEIGDVFVLEDQVTDAREFFRVQDVDHEVQIFTDDQGDFQARVVTITITQPLSAEFPGSQPSRYFVSSNTASIVRKTSPSDAARYRGTVPLDADASAGALTIKLGTVFGQLVPSTVSESGIADAEPTGVTVRAECALAEVTTERVLTGVINNTDYWMSLLPGAMEGSARLEVWTSNFVTKFAEFEDNGDGTFTQTIGSLGGHGSVRIESYETGALAYSSGDGNTDRGLRVYWIPMATLSRTALSFQTPVKLNTRGYVYIATLKPVPTPGTATVSFRALGRWYTLTDDGTGALTGEAGTGSGQVNYVTGTVTVTLGALPDIGSSVIFAWGADSELEIRTGDTEIKPPRVELTLAHELEPDSLSLSWTAGGVTKTATCNAAGIISGDATGYVEPDSQKVVFRPTLIPDDNSTIEASYGDYDQAYVDELFNPPESGGTLSITLADLPKAGTVTITTLIYFRNGDQAQPFTFVLKDDGAGKFVSQGYPTPAEITSVGAINYGTGVITLPATITYSSGQPVYEQLTDALPGRTLDSDTGLYSAVSTPRRKAVGQEVTSGSWTFNDSGSGEGGAVTVQYVAASAGVGSPYNEEFPMPALTLDLTPGIGNVIVPGGLLLEFGGRRYIDRSGTLYHSINAATGAGTAGGTINYTSGTVTVTDYVSNVAPAFSVKALLTEVKKLPLSVLHARTPGSPLRPGSFYLQANRYSDSALISAIADTDGNISTADMHGYVDVVTGVFSVAFGAYVLDSSLTADEKAEPWYNAGNVSGGYIWRPREVIPGTVRFNCVVQTNLPLDPEIIGVNPVRLPLDGRVQIIRAGDTLVFHDTQSYTAPDPLSAGQELDLGREDLASVVIYDDDGVAVATTKYTVDLEAGTVTMADPLDLSGYNQPLHVLHTIEDMALCIDAQITGEVTIAQPLTHNYTDENSLCSSALILGDVQARVEHLFAQNTWTGVWEDELIGSAPVSGAQYNDVTYPLAVLNRDAITQRWRLAFTSSSAFNVVGEELGIVGTGTTAADVAPINPATGQPYFTLDKDGFGAGWATGNTIRFNTVAAGAPVWIARTVKSGPATFQDDLIRVQTRWDKD